MFEFISTKKNLNLPTFFSAESIISLNALKDIAEALNKLFSDSRNKLAAKIQAKRSLKKFLKGRNPNLMALFLPTFVEIYDAIHSLKNKKSSGVDTILSLLLKVTFLMITPYLMLLFNVCFKNGLFPEVLKVSDSKVIFSYKSGDKTKLNNVTDQSIYCHHYRSHRKATRCKIVSLSASGIIGAARGAKGPGSPQSKCHQ